MVSRHVGCLFLALFCGTVCGEREMGALAGEPPRDRPRSNEKAANEPCYRWVEVTSKAAFAARDGAGALVFQGKMWLLGGWNPSDKARFPRVCNNEVWCSADGVRWHLVKPNTFGTPDFDPEHDWEGRHTAGYVVYKNRMWIVGGDANQGHYQSDVWNSRDGKTWTWVNKGQPVPWGPRVLHYTLVFKDAIWVMGGQTLPHFAQAPERFYRDVWKTTDGVHWTKLQPKEPYWSARGMLGGSVVFEGRMWILGGGTYDTPGHKKRDYYNDVWSSADGIHWTCHLHSAPWHPRSYHDVAVFDDRMWVLEGHHNRGGNRNDVWYSADGVHWHQVPNTPWKPRHAASVFVHNGALWMVAGNNMQPDVWKLQRVPASAARAATSQAAPAGRSQDSPKRSSKDLRGEKEILQSAFRDPLLPTEMIFPPISTLEGIHRANRTMFFPVKDFFDAYRELKVQRTSHLVLDDGATHVLKVTYQLRGRRYDAYAYAPLKRIGSQAALIIPGSGHNQSYPIYKRDPGNYHRGIYAALPGSCDRYVFIKLNEDCLAFHNRTKKLHLHCYVNWQLEHGGSYSARYLVDSLAVIKFLRGQYGKVLVAGLSQGGRAALLSAVQSEPDAAIVASGFTVLRDTVQVAGHNQIILPGLRKQFSFDAIRARIRRSSTQYLFTYGEQERGTYRLEVEKHLTKRFFAGCDNVTVENHSGGHAFPTEVIKRFLARHGWE
ncbi:MAG: hypothetical protein GXP27_12945 [Planctomycetes bacterium]|nr:hypothetical protein [Planctomycetota bacterium]